MASPEAGQNLRNNMVELNNWLKPMAGNINQVIGPKQVAQANDAQFDYFTFQLKAGKQSIRPQIIAWPYAADDDGAAFDQSNLWGVRLNAYNPEQNAVIAVPKTLPSGYTSTVSRGGWQCPIGGINVPVDYFSADSGATWSNNGTIFSVPQSTYYLRQPPNIGSVPKYWGPMNWANKSGAGASFSFGGGSYGTTAGVVTYLQPIADDHIGFRRIRARYSGSGISGGMTSALGTLYIGYTATGAGLTYPALPTSVFSQAITKASLTSDGPTNSHVDVLCTTAQAPVVGTRVKWWMWFVWDSAAMTSFYSFSSVISPRTDVPFPFDVVGLGDGTSSDWHAPGGYV